MGSKTCPSLGMGVRGIGDEERVRILDGGAGLLPAHTLLHRHDALGYSVIDVPVRDDNVEEISCEGYDKPAVVVYRKFPGHN